MSKLFKQRVLNTFARIKQEKFNQNLPRKLPIFDHKEELVAFLRPITKNTSKNRAEIHLLAKWRAENAFAFPSQFKVTFAGTKKWVERQLVQHPSRILFFIESNEAKPRLVGQIGLFLFNFRDNSCEIDNVVRGDKNYLKGVMTWALLALIKWTQVDLQPNKIYLRVFQDNKHAIDFYRRCGFTQHELIPLRKVEKPGAVIWQDDRKLKQADKYFLKMVLQQKK